MINLLLTVSFAVSVDISDEEEVRAKPEQKRHHQHRHHRRHEKLEAAMAVGAGYISRPKDKLKEELKAKKKVEKEKAKMEKKVEKLGVKLAAASVHSSKTEVKQKGHGK